MRAGGVAIDTRIVEDPKMAQCYTDAFSGVFQEAVQNRVRGGPRISPAKRFPRRWCRQRKVSPVTLSSAIAVNVPAGTIEIYMESIFIFEGSVETYLFAVGLAAPPDPAIVRAVSAELVEKIRHQ